MGLLLAGALIGGALGLGKAAVGAVQAAKGSKQMKSLLANRPRYTIPEAYQKALGIYQKMAAQEMPGMGQYKDMYGEATARTITAAEKGAISSNVYEGAVQAAQDKELQALQQLALLGAQYKIQAMQNLASAQQQMGEQQQLAWDYNVNIPYQQRLNMAAEKKVAGWQNLYSGLEDIGSSVTNLIGTKYFADALKGLQSQSISQATASSLRPSINTGTEKLFSTASSAMPRATFPTEYDWMWSNLRKQGIVK